MRCCQGTEAAIPIVTRLRNYAVPNVCIQKSMCLLLLRLGLRKLPRVRQKLPASHVLLQYLWNAQPFRCLIVLHDGTHGSLSSAQSAVEHVYISFYSITLFLDTTSHLQGARFCVKSQWAS